MAIFVRTVPNVMRHFNCSAEAAQAFIDLRDEGHSHYVASVMAGLADPQEPASPDRLPLAAAPDLLELAERCELWARQVSEQQDVRVGIRHAGAKLANELREVISKATGVPQ